MATSNAFNRAGWHYAIAQVAALVCAGWLLTENVALSHIGFTQWEGWPANPATVACWSMAAAETGVMILLTAVDYWDDIYRALVDFGADSPDRVPRVARFILIGLVASIMLGIVAVIYWFDFHSTHMGLYGDGDITPKSTGFTLFFNLGSEVLAFLAGQIGRLSKYAKRRSLEERSHIDPHIAYGERMVTTMSQVATEQADAEAAKMWQAFYKQHPNVRAG
jgi:hypothetical protein